MAVYKVIQDIEAEDKLLGPLTLKGLIYAGLAAGLGFISFQLLTSTSLGPGRWVIILIFFFPMALFGILASPLGRDQPTEVWLLSHLRFFVKPKRRVWNQSGVSNLVTITAPKKIERHLTKDLSQSEVKSRLKALATTLDSHGWAVKNVGVNLSTSPVYTRVIEPESDRLVDASVLSRDVPTVDISASEDILDEQNNLAAKNLDKLMKKADADYKKQIISRFNAAREDGAAQAGSTAPSPTVSQTALPDEEEIDNRRWWVKKNAKHPSKAAAHSHKPAVTPHTQAAKLELAQSGKAFKVSTLAHLANRQTERIKQIGPNEVEISLH